MLHKKTKRNSVVTFSHYCRKGYNAFASLKREVRIGVLAVSMLSSIQPEKMTAQTASHPEKQPEETRSLDEVTVAGTLAPLTNLQSARIVSVITRDEIQRAAVQTVNDLLKLAVGVDVRQRGGFGIQTDISIDGGTFDQLTLLLNGVNINNPQTGHLSADFPVNLSDIERIEILEGAASRVYGGSAFGGAVNIVTRSDAQSGVSVGAQSGSYGTWGGDARINLSKGSFHNRLSGGYTQSDGGTDNSDFRRQQFFYQADLKNKDFDVNWQAGYSNKQYGANTFYSGAYPNQFEKNRRFMASVGAETKGRLHLTPTVYWNRSFDHYQLIRNSSVGENFHRTDVCGASLRGYFNWVAGKTAVGAELRNEGILSTNLGSPLEAHLQPSIPGQEARFYTHKDNRTNVSYHLEHNVLLNRFTLSVGVMANMNTAVDHRYRFYPGVDAAYAPTAHWKVFASYNKGFRLPTFTDLYYKSPTQAGNVGLKPEETQSFALGARYRRPGFTATAKGFYHKGHHMIDWVMYTAEDVYHSANFDLDNMGAQVQADLDFGHLFRRDLFLQRLHVGYTYIYQKRHDDTPIYKSNYALEYLRHKFVARLDHKIWSRLSANWSLRWQDRMGAYILYENAKNTGRLTDYSPYATLDLKIQWTTPKYSVYVEGNNLTNKQYHDLGNIPQPGLWIMAGARWNLNF